MVLISSAAEDRDAAATKLNPCGASASCRWILAASVGAAPAVAGAGRLCRCNRRVRLADLCASRLFSFPLIVYSVILYGGLCDGIYYVALRTLKFSTELA
jgi:hypothetical protein